MVIPPEVLSLFRIILVNLVFQCVFPYEAETCPYKNCVGILLDLHWVYILLLVRQYFYYVNPVDPWAWEICSTFDSFDFFLQRLKFLSYRPFTCFIRVTLRHFILFEIIVKCLVSLILFSVCFSFVYTIAMSF